MPKGVTYNQTQYDQAEAIADALKSAGTVGGDATKDNQQTEITRLTEIRDRTPALGAATAANSCPVTLANDGVFVNTVGNTTDAAATSDTANASLISLVRRLLQRLTALFGRPALTILIGTLSTSGDTTLIAAPGAGVSINIAYLKVQLEGTTATTVIIKSGTNARERALCASQGDGLVLNFFPNRELQLDANTALVINLSGSNAINYTFHYFTS